ncbi:SusC/RagA family TonB-linked outer membrane protein [Fibrella aquatilis]|uniref:TonB-dependent receptor n=1 Tax=Fibrella aquatilis TaxID=2817059 RepID=A0A939K0G4_9BACT|nr:TonB-dependent receptor [Fibrella aquatilis]MBO0931976.1 TonB-dependent receptor [Fibrella aquatilis]
MNKTTPCHHSARPSVFGWIRIALLALLLGPVFAFTSRGYIPPTVATIPIRVSGTISDATGNRLAGANIVVKGTQRGTSTDAEGRYSLSVDDAGTTPTLVVSLLGYATQEIVVDGRATIDVRLADDSRSLNEVVVLGYGAQRKDALTAAVSTVKTKELTISPAANVSNLIAGRVNGVLFVQDQGQPGDDQTRIFVRGLASFSSSNDPLYVIDGIPRDANAFNRLTPSDIESISVLKDAAAAAVFGARSANGVILVTTRRGVAGKTSFSYTANFGTQTPTQLPKFVNSADFATLYNEARVNDGQTVRYTDDEITKFRDGSDPIFYPNTDWVDLLYGKSAPITQHNLTVNGGTEKVQYLLSVNYLNQQNLLAKGIGLDRYNVRSNIDARVTNTTRVSLDVTGTLQKNEKRFGSFSDVFREPATIPAIFPNGLYSAGRFTRNDLANIREGGYQRESRNNLFARLDIRQEIPMIPGLSVRGIAAYDVSFDRNKEWSNLQQLYTASRDNAGLVTYKLTKPSDPQLREILVDVSKLTLEAQANYSHSFGKHDVGGLFVVNRIQEGGSYLNASRSGYILPVIETIFAGSGPVASVSNSGNEQQTNPIRRQSLVGRATYGYNNRYLLEGSFRYDGSNIFGPGYRYGFFPAVSAGWVVSEESFMKGASFLDFLKIRGSWGKLGNDRINGYQYTQLYNLGSNGAVIDGKTQGYIVPGVTANPFVTWENSTKTDVGFEARFGRGLSVEADYFYERRSDILTNRSQAVATVFGGSLPAENIGQTQNQGFEVSLGYQKQFGKDLTFNARANFTRAVNKIIDRAEPANINPLRRQAGRALFTSDGYIADGLFGTQEEINTFFGTNIAQYKNVKPGDIRYRDLNGDQKIDGNDVTQIARTNLPPNVYSLNLAVNYKGFELTTLFQGAWGGQVALDNWLMHPFRQDGNVLEIAKDHWSTANPNPNALFPRLSTNSTWNFIPTSTFWVQDTDYLRLKNVQLSYTLPRAVSAKIHAQAIRFYANTSNLLTFSALKFKIVDPEQTSSGAIYPQQRVINVGANITF